ncbi:MAG TPA: hypothetical protein VJ963_09215 [Bacteroidales bacterium]|nr:hypothetical protein [Bacteroidales bacterium]
MRILRITPIIALFILGITVNANAQCKAFAKKVCLPELGSYTHDGNYHAAVLVEGEEAELYKTFYSDMEYRVAVSGEEDLPKVEFKVLDADKNVLYSNKDNDYSPTWDFKLESSQQLKIVVKVLTSDQAEATPESGCVSIMFGFRMKK